MLSSGVFGRLTGKRQQGQTLPYANASSASALSASPVTSPSTDTITGPPPDDVPELERRQTTGTSHRRESSILSLTNSVTDLGQNVRNVRRSVSLRSHRTNPSTSSTSSVRPANYPRNPSMSNVNNLPSQLVESPELEQEQDPVHTSPIPPRSRGKLSISARSFSNRFKSTDTLPILSPESAEDPPPVPQIESNRTTTGAMLAPTQPRRPPPEKPVLTSQQSFSRDPASSFGTGLPLPHNLATANLNVNGSYNPTAIYQNIHETAAKRMATIEYMRKVHDGNVFYFSTLHLTSATLGTMSSLQQHKLGRRATSYMVLGYSLPALLDMNSGTALEYLKAFSALLQEFETYQSLMGFDSSGSSLSRGRVGQMFKSSMGLGTRSGKARRTSAATESVAIDPKLMLGAPSLSNDPTSPLDIPSPVLGHEFQHLLTPNLPFDPDFSTTYATLCDTLVDTYAKLVDLVTGPEMCTPSVGDAFIKADKSVRKILVSNVIREFDDTTRANVKGEVAGLGKLVLGGLM
nr:hypothetical protein CFP56_52435 [Quercus suber]